MTATKMGMENQFFEYNSLGVQQKTGNSSLNYGGMSSQAAHIFSDLSYSNTTKIHSDPSVHMYYDRLVPTENLSNSVDGYSIELFSGIFCTSVIIYFRKKYRKMAVS